MGSYLGSLSSKRKDESRKDIRSELRDEERSLARVTKLKLGSLNAPHTQIMDRRSTNNIRTEQIDVAIWSNVKNQKTDGFNFPQCSEHFKVTSL